MRCSSRFESGFCQVREMVSKKTLVQPQGKVVRREEMSRGIHRTTNVHGWSVPALPYMSLLAWASSSNRGISPSLTHPQAHPKKELQSGWRRNEGFIGRKVAAVSFAKVIFVRVYHNNWQVMLHYITLLCYLLYFAGKLRWQISSAKRLMCLVLCFTTTLLAPFLGVYARPGSIVSIPSYVQYEQLIKDIHGQDGNLAEVMLHFFIRQSFIPDYSCCHHQAWINRPKTSSFKSYFKRAMSICRAYIMGPDSAHASAVVIRMLDNPRSRCDWRWFESYCILESNKKCLFTYENKQKAVNLFY